MGDWLVQEVLEYFVRVVLEPLPHLLLLVRDLVLHIPLVTDQVPVFRLMGNSLLVVQVSYVVLVVVAGIVAMTHGGLQSEYSAKALLQRAVLGFVAAHYVRWIVDQSTHAANALIGALAPPGPRSLKDLDSSEAVAAQIAKAPESVFLLLIMQGVIVVLIVVLLIGWVTRLLRLMMLAGLGPLALACHGLPWLEPVASAWWRSLFSVLVTVVAQAALLQFGLILLSPRANLSWIGTFDRSDVLISMLLTLCLLLAVIRMPALVGQFIPVAGGQRGRGTFGMVLRYTLLNRTLSGGSGRNAPMGRLASRFHRRQMLSSTPGQGPTWTGIWQGTRRAATPWGSGLRSWSTSVAASGVGPGRATPAQQQLVRVRRQWSGRRAALNGRTVGNPGQQAPRVAGGSRTQQQTGAAALLQQRKAHQNRQGQTTGRARLRARPLPGRTAGNPTARSTPTVAGNSKANNGRSPGCGGGGGGWSRGWAPAPGSTSRRRTPQQRGQGQASIPVTRPARVQPNLSRPAPNGLIRVQRGLNRAAAAQTPPRRAPQRLRPSTARSNPPVRRRRTPPP